MEKEEEKYWRAQFENMCLADMKDVLDVLQDVIKERLEENNQTANKIKHLDKVNRWVKK